MTMYIEPSRPVPFGAELSLRVVNFVDTSVANFREWNATRKTKNALDRLSPSQLKDIGLNTYSESAASLEWASRRYW